MVSFKPGDLVWVNDFKNVVKVINGELPAVVIALGLRRDTYCSACNGTEGYELDILPPGGLACPCCLRPRRDDYQQREPLGSMDEVFAPTLNEASIELAREAMLEAKADACG